MTSGTLDGYIKNHSYSIVIGLIYFYTWSIMILHNNYWYYRDVSLIDCRVSGIEVKLRRSSGLEFFARLGLGSSKHRSLPERATGLSAPWWNEMQPGGMSGGHGIFMGNSREISNCTDFFHEELKGIRWTMVHDRHSLVHVYIMMERSSAFCHGKTHEISTRPCSSSQSVSHYQRVDISGLSSH